MKKISFVWMGLSNQNKKCSGEIQAASINLAKIYLQRQGITIVSIRKKIKNIFHPFTQKISALDIAVFFRQLATLIAADIPIVQSFEILSQTQEKIQLQKLIVSVKNEIEAGKNLVTGLRKFPRYFDELNCHLVHAGEYSGTLEKMLYSIAHYKEKTLALKNQVKQALFYPAIIFLVASVVTLMMLIFVVPRFAELFQSMHSQLPAFTQFVIELSNFLSENSWLFILPILGIVIFIYYFKKSLLVQQKIDHALLVIPFVSTIIKKIVLARLTRSLATTLSAGIPITDALKIIANISGNHDYFKAIQALEQKVLAGQQLHAAMQLNPLFTPLTVQMIRVGEESGTLDFMLDKIAGMYESDIDHIVANLNHLLEPLIMVILGVLIGGLVIAMYLPIFKLGTVI